MHYSSFFLIVQGLKYMVQADHQHYEKFKAPKWKFDFQKVHYKFLQFLSFFFYYDVHVHKSELNWKIIL